MKQKISKIILPSDFAYLKLLVCPIHQGWRQEDNYLTWNLGGFAVCVGVVGLGKGDGGCIIHLFVWKGVKNFLEIDKTFKFCIFILNITIC